MHVTGNIQPQTSTRVLFICKDWVLLYRDRHRCIDYRGTYNSRAMIREQSGELKARYKNLRPHKTIWSCTAYVHEGAIDLGSVWHRESSTRRSWLRRGARPPETSCLLPKGRSVNDYDSDKTPIQPCDLHDWKKPISKFDSEARDAGDWTNEGFQVVLWHWHFWKI